VLFHHFKEFADLVGLGVLVAGLHRERSRQLRVDVLPVASLGPGMFEPKCSQQPLEVAEGDRPTAAAIGEQAGVQFVDAGYGGSVRSF
jgi:hypothetical protein